MSTPNLLSIEEAKQIILSDINICLTEDVSLEKSYSRVLAEDIKAPFSIPPHNNSAMDGYAFVYNDIKDKRFPIKIPICGEIPAGNIYDKKVNSGETVRIMTGSVIPEGADTVIPFELTNENGNILSINENVDLGMNIRLKGEDVEKGDLVLKKGKVLRPQDTGMASSFGYDRLKVFKKPKVGIISTGNEIVNAGDKREEGQIYNINAYSLAGQIIEMGGEPVILGIASDSKENLINLIENGIDQNVDILISSGGISAGNFDFVREVLDEHGSVYFHQVMMRPGKPFSYGKIGKTLFFGLPGNPVASMISTEILVKPLIKKLGGASVWQPFYISAIIDQNIKKNKGLTYIYRVVLNKRGSSYYAKLTGAQGSGILRSMVEADGLAVISEDIGNIKQGDKIEVIPFSSLYKD